ncbi:MAG: carbamoyltransferase [Legionellales bacterium]|nr:carbamoyltransferase [Legionellales bacterium]
MRILGINDGHNASVCLTENGVIKFALSEERPTRKKNYFGMPIKAINHVYDNLADKDSIDYFGIYRDHGGDFLAFRWAIPDPTKKMSFAGKALRLVVSRVATKYMEIVSLVVPKSLVRRHYARYLKVPVEKVVLVNHHRSHAESAVLSLDASKEWLIFTVDAEGDSESGTVHSVRGNNILKLASIKRRDSLGYFYTWITEYLGMKPNEHEFKVMGLEPYVRKNTDQYLRAYKKLSGLFRFEGLNYVANVSMVSRRYKKWLRSMLYKERFDNIAAAAQKTLEETVTKWISGWIKQTGIHNLALSGGTFMNVKASQRISALHEVGDFYVVPSSGDETTVIGVCNYISRQKGGKNLNPLSDLYLGVEFADEELLEWAKNVGSVDLEVKNVAGDIENAVAKLLSEGQIVARFAGREEFGARALGNRSILAHPSNPETISQINKMIKDRDFWMPFTPSILAEEAHSYIQNPKGLNSPYMAMTFDTTETGREHFSAAIHPYDKTMRIQMVDSGWNPAYHKLIRLFGEKTGIYGLLNTSFNLHGEPNVHTPNDALRTLTSSGLNHLAIGPILISKIKS